MNLRTTTYLIAIGMLVATFAALPAANATNNCPLGTRSPYACVNTGAFSSGDGDCDDATSGRVANSIMLIASPDRTVGGYAIVGTECDDNEYYEWNALTATGSFGSPAGGASASARWNYYDPGGATYCNSYVIVNGARTDVPLCAAAGGPPEVPVGLLP